MNAPTKIVAASSPELIAFAEALARAHVARDIAASRTSKDSPVADRHLRPLQQR